MQHYDPSYRGGGGDQAPLVETCSEGCVGENVPNFTRRPTKILHAFESTIKKRFNKDNEVYKSFIFRNECIFVNPVVFVVLLKDKSHWVE